MKTRARRPKKLGGIIFQPNEETGELEEMNLKKGESLKYEAETGEWVLKFENFVASDAYLDKHLSMVLSASEYMRYHQIARLLHTPFNIVQSGNNRPHTLKSLAEEIQLNEDDTRRLINKLVGLKLADWSIRPESGHDKKILMLNPFFVRKRSTINELLIEIFPDFADEREAIKSSTKKRPRKYRDVLVA
jgi:hypothetical protein